jgi:hypothetical protein
MWAAVEIVSQLFSTARVHKTDTVKHAASRGSRTVAGSRIARMCHWRARHFTVIAILFSIHFAHDSKKSAERNC